MSFFKNLLKRFENPPGPPRDFSDELQAAAVPSVKLVPDPSGASEFYPAPVLPAGIEWPLYEGSPKMLVLSLDLTDVARAHRFDWLPAEGKLLFFCDEENFWDADDVTVLHVAPGTPLVAFDGGPDHEYTAQRVRSEAFPCCPSPERFARMSGLALTAEESDQLLEWQEHFHGEHAVHRVAGFPDPIQGDEMEDEAAMHRLGMDFEHRDEDAIRQEAANWRLLCQIGSDDAHGTCFGDMGTLYVYIREDEAKRGDFSRVFNTCQCS